MGSKGPNWAKRVRTPGSEAGVPGRALFPLGAADSEKKLRRRCSCVG